MMAESSTEMSTPDFSRAIVTAKKTASKLRREVLKHGGPGNLLAICNHHHL
jgi:hypothetical protein